MAKAFAGPLEAFRALERNPDLSVSHADVSAWMQSDDLQALGVMDAFLDKWADAISPPLILHEVDAFKRVFYGRCLRENPQTEWAPSRYEAGWELANWLKHLIDAPDGGEAAIARWRDWLAEEYRGGDAEIRECLINSTLERAFELPEIKRLFDAWKQDDALRDVYTKAAK